MITIGRLVHSARKRAQSVQYKFWEVQASIRRNGASAYWWRGNFNFGDLLTPVLLRHYGFTPVFARPDKAGLSAAGSVLDEFPEDYKGIILGSGFIRPSSPQKFPKALVLTVRGKLTLQKLGRSDETRLGDPGLLASRVLPGGRRKRYRLGIIPHYIDWNQENFARLRERVRPGVRFINVGWSPMKVFEEIDRCENVISSSLHGLISADSFGVPNAWIESKNLPDGRFKFDDYYSALGIRENPASLGGDEPLDKLIDLCSLKPQDDILRIQDNLDRIWRGLGERLGVGKPKGFV